jgi:putative flippase GtrA
MHLFVRILRYGIVGTTIAVIYSLAIVLFVASFHVSNPTLASVLAFAAVLPLAYLAHRNVTFRDAPRDPSQLRRFAITNAAGFAVTTAGMYLLTAILKYPYYYGIALNWALIPAANFVIYLVWVFRAGRPGAAAFTPAAALAFRSKAGGGLEH